MNALASAAVRAAVSLDSEKSIMQSPSQPGISIPVIRRASIRGGLPCSELGH